MAEKEHIDFERYRQDTDTLAGLAENLRDLIDQFPEVQQEEQLFGEWTLKDILSHFSAWANLTLDSISRSETGEPIPILLDDDVCDWFNREGIMSRRPLSWEEVYGEFISTETRLHAAYAALSETEPNDLKAEFLEFCIEGDLEHYRSHLDSLANVFKSL